MHCTSLADILGRMNLDELEVQMSTLLFRVVSWCRTLTGRTLYIMRRYILARTIPVHKVQNPSLVEYFEHQIGGTIGLIKKDAWFRYRFFGEYLQKRALLGEIQSMLCVGCRNAYEIDYFMSLGVSKVVGIDLVSVDSRIYCMDMHNMNFPDSHFDAVYAGDSFEHTYDVDLLAREFVRGVVPGGLIIMSVPANEETDHVDRLFGSKADDIYDIFGSACDKVILEDDFCDDSGTTRALRLIFRTRSVEA